MGGSGDERRPPTLGSAEFDELLREVLGRVHGVLDERERWELLLEAVGSMAADLSLDDIARRIASSRRQLQRAFAEIGQTTFRDHLTQVRMRRAAELLATLGLTVREVANRVGYLLLALAVALFFIALMIGFDSTMSTLVIVTMIAAFVLLAPSIVLGYAVKAADRDDRERGL